MMTSDSTPPGGFLWLVGAILASAFLSAIAFAQHHQSYAGQDAREIKALSADEVKQYLAGAGAGFARAAELNHFPGPMHVLELADRLELTTGQRAQTARLMNSHNAEARAIGEKVIAAERALDALFGSGRVDEARLSDAVRAAAQAQGEYRLSHLDTHRRMRALLSEEQVAAYDRLRGSANREATHRHEH